MLADKATKAEVNAILDGLAQAVRGKRIREFIKYFSNDPNMMTIGPESEGMNLGYIKLKDTMEKTFEGAEVLNWKYGWTSIKSNGPVAWVASHVTYTIKKKDKHRLELSTRFTCVLEKDRNKWLINQFHFSLPIPIEAPEETEEEKKAKVEAKATEKKAKKTGAKARAELEDTGFYEVP